MSVVFIFIDGVGVGKPSSVNPLSGNGWNSFSVFTGMDGLDDSMGPVFENNLLYTPIDANLGIQGLPQSGTGQTTLFSGVNASEIAGKHYGPFPYSTTRYLLEGKSLFHKIIDFGFKPVFLNAYPEIFFIKSRKSDRWTATTLMAKSAGIPLKTVDDLLNENAITAEITQKIWREQLGLDVPEITPRKAAERVLNATKDYDLVMYEFYLTDKAGHSMNKPYADQIRDLLDPFLNHLIANLNKKQTLVISSDHGNLEDLSIKSHTRNPVPLFVKGNTKHFSEAKSIMDVTPGIINTLK